MFLRFLPFVVFDGNDPTAAEPTAPAAPETPPAQPAPALQPGPWSADLEAAFEDPSLRQQVDGFLREKVQPRVTQLETQFAERKAAHELYDDLSGDESDQALMQVIAELHDPEIAQKFAELLTPAQPAPETPAPPQAELPPEVQEMIAERQAQKEAEDYDNELARVKGLHPELIDDEFHPFVAGAEGDFDRALESYKVWQAQARERYGAPPQPTPDPSDTAPAPLTSENPAAPPVQPKFDSISDALDAFMDEQRGGGPAPVGVV